MPTELVGPDFVCRYRIIDIRTVDEDFLLSSPFDVDNILAILTRHRDRRQTIQRILQRIDTMEVRRRDEAMKKLMILAGLRGLEDSINWEMTQMPILNDIMDHKIIGPAIRQGIQKGEVAILRGQLTKRFGELPGWVAERLSNSSTSELEDLSLRLFDVQRLDELFPR